MISLADEQPPEEGRPLLATVMRNGRRTGRRPTLDECRKRLAADLAELPSAARRIRAPAAPRATASERLSALASRVRRRIGEETSAPTARPPSPEQTASGSHRSLPK
ncbi:hypothetical protein ACF08N_35195 [Streptomyces sp. NPDC015127]|uniref:hypothetical protein n=1 Tax=Streptomyces sp. NPDC015127 TaxID=3364939 RepID=UPI0036FE0E13